MSETERKALDTKIRYLREELARLKRERESRFGMADPYVASWIVTFDWDPDTPKQGGAVYLNGSKIGFIENVEGVYLVYRSEHDDMPLVPKATNLLGNAVGMLVDHKIGTQT